MHNTKKIRLTCNWKSIPTDEILVKRFNSCFITKNNFNPDYIFTHEDDFDYLVILNAPRNSSLNKLINPSKTIINYMEPSWHPYIYKNHDLNLLRSDWIVFHNKFLYNNNNNKNSIEIPGILPHQLFENDCNLNLDELIQNTFHKFKKCSFIISDKIHFESSCISELIYKKRLCILSKILKSDLDISIYGRGLDLLKTYDNRVKGEIDYKFNALKNYQFSICIENSIEEGYFSEKLFDCILTDTIPIYIGCPNIKDYFNNIHMIDINPDNAIKQITHILNNNLILDQSENKKLLEYKYNFYFQIVNLIKKI